jgi:hypothetical protein
MAKAVSTTRAVAVKGAEPEKIKKSWFASIFRATDL